MTLRMAAMPSFRDLREESRPQAESNLRRLPLELLEYALTIQGVKADFGAVLEELADAHLFTEERHAAEQRLFAAREFPTGEAPDRPSQRFTVALTTSKGRCCGCPTTPTTTTRTFRCSPGPRADQWPAAYGR